MFRYENEGMTTLWKDDEFPENATQMMCVLNVRVSPWEEPQRREARERVSELRSQLASRVETKKRSTSKKDKK